ncbi:hypothetical protein DFP73DRAFT_527139 [Morchella snyderi]|nr:hypothetical protein DFP73DRAFT_527139 [Morchella snyderi]
MSALYKQFRLALKTQNGQALGAVFSPRNADISSFAFSTNHANVRRDIEYELMQLPAKSRPAWVEAFIGLWKVAYTLERDEEPGAWARAYEGQKETMLAVVRGYQNASWPHWTLPVMYTACKYLRTIAMKADEEGKTGCLEDAARIVNRAFTVCISDRAPLEESRKWGTYYIVNLLFKTYFKLNAITLSKNILRALAATTADMPPLSAFPKAHQVTFKYYVGVIYFLEENYALAEENLMDAWKLCHPDATRNQELILTYLIPTKLCTTHTLPTAALLSRYHRLHALFAPLCTTIKSGNLLAFDAAMAAGEQEFVKRRIFLTLERGREIAMRNLFRKVYLYCDKSTRIPVRTFQAAMGSGMVEVEGEEVECLIAGLIYKGLVKGYISREKQMVVLSGTMAFPGTGV